MHQIVCGIKVRVNNNTKLAFIHTLNAQVHHVQDF